MKRIPLGVLAGVTAVVCIGCAGPAAASTGTVHPLLVHTNSLSDCFVTASAPSVSGGIVSFSADAYCDTIVDFLQVDVTLTTVVGGVTRPIAGNSCMDSSTSGIYCTASAYCQGTNYYGGTGDFSETNADDYSSYGSWTQPPVWVGC